MADCMYIVTQDELDELEHELRSRLEGYKATSDAIKKAVDALSAAFAQVALAVEKILKSFSDWYLEIIGADPEIYKPRPKPKRPQRKILLRSRIIDHRDCIYSLLPKRRSV